MHKIELPEREGWREMAQEVGFTFADMHGEPYWDETSAYEFTLDEIETRIEAPSSELHAMCREAVDRIVNSEELIGVMGLPEAHWDLVRNSWRDGQPELYGRFDLVYDGKSSAKLLEYNADTPTSLYESAAFQWQWLEEQIAADVLEADCDQFNGVHEALVERFRALFEPQAQLHFTAMANAPEDYATVEALGWAAREAGLGAHYFELEKLGLSEEKQFLDDEDRVIGTLFKLYPWEDLLREDFAQYLAGAGVQYIEPAWKALLSNKAILPMLWYFFEGHPNLLPAYFEEDVAQALAGQGRPAPEIGESFARAHNTLLKGYVTKPIFSREGASVSIVEGDRIEKSAQDGYGQFPRIVQAYQPLPEFSGFRPIIGSWIVGEECAGIGIREDRSRITQDLSRFKPHFIRG